jgi:alkylation response protein AidB-like acyl-CoA dehydrogenase
MRAQSAPMEAIQDLGPLIGEHAEFIERERRLPGAVVCALADAGVFRLFIPQALGGLEAGPATA